MPTSWHSSCAGRGHKRDHVAHVRLEAAAILYRHIGRAPIGTVAGAARTKLTDGLSLHPGLLDAASNVLAVWTRGKAWNGFLPIDAEKLRIAFALAQAILDGKHGGSDYRTFSRRIAGDSKVLEWCQGVVVRLLAKIIDLPPGAKPREALRTLGLEKFAPPLLISGRINLLDADLAKASLLYLGISPNEADRVRFREEPAYLLTIENYASFNRHIIEADPDRLGTTVYVGGYPSLATQHALRLLTSKFSESVPIYHWSDIDPDGTWIFRTIERALGRQLRPHLMSPEIAEKFGKAAAGISRFRPAAPDSGIFMLAEYLASANAKLLEQEELDPQIPAG